MKKKHIITGAIVAVAAAMDINYVQVKSNNIVAHTSDIYPQSQTTGATNPDITQLNIGDNICNPNWSTKSIRPPVNYTNALKAKQIKEYGYTDTNMADYEEDHLISLELGGSPTDPKNLWPESYNGSLSDGGARSKDQVENALHKAVCNGSMSLSDAQKIITTDWYGYLKKIK